MFSVYCMVVILLSKHCGSEYTDFTTCLWLHSIENTDPYTVWNDPGSTYNSATNRTITDLIGSNEKGYRNTIIDNWATEPPDLIKVVFRNSEGAPLYTAKFNSTESTLSSWFTVPNMESAYTDACTIYNDFGSYSVSFSLYNNSWGVQRYRAVSLQHHDPVSTGLFSTHYLVSSTNNPLLLPVTDVSECHASFTDFNPFVFNSSTVSNVFHAYCSSMCRENNHTYGAVHGVQCSCLDTAVAGPDLNACVTPCEGVGLQMCGGDTPIGYPAETIIFNTVNTDIDATQFDVPLNARDLLRVTGAFEVSYASPLYLYGFDVNVASSGLPVTIRMVLYYRPTACSDTTTVNQTLINSFQVLAPQRVNFGPIHVQCAYIYLYDNATQNPLTFEVNLTSIAIDDNRFVEARLISIEAAWLIHEEPACECECWIYNMLYGGSPFDNLTYAEIEFALQNITQKLQKELAVNKSELSSTIRKKTSADDDRRSAAVVGYSLGVALLTVTIGGIVLSDVPKMIGGFHILKKNLGTLFGRDVPPPPDVTLRTMPTNSAIGRETLSEL